MFMNDYDIQYARQRFGRGWTPNRLALAIMVDRLAEWTNTVSDGWAYWAKPRNAARQAMEHLVSKTSQFNDLQMANDITEEQMLAAVRPVKAFLARMAREQHGLYPGRPMVTDDERELILRSTRPMFEVI